MAIAKVFFDVNTGLGVPGLTSLCWELKTKVGEGRYVMFMNRRRTKVKILFDERTMIAYSKPVGQITLEELENLPMLMKGDWMPDGIAKKVETWLEKPITLNSSMVKAG